MVDPALVRHVECAAGGAWMELPAPREDRRRRRKPALDRCTVVLSPAMLGGASPVSPPAHRQLSAELDRLATDALFEQIKTVLDGLSRPLQQGGRLDRSFPDLDPPLYCRSFATVYVLSLWTSRHTNEFLLQRAVRKALPTIESLTLSLPPPGGADPSSGAQHGSA